MRESGPTNTPNQRRPSAWQASGAPSRATLALRQHELVLHQAAMRRCTRCVDAGFIPEGFPVFHGRAEQRIMVVGQAPAMRRSEHPMPYTGASGRTLRSWLEQAGFPPGALHQHFYLTSLTKCFPGPSQNGKGDRPPSTAEIALCRPHLERELALVQPEVVLTLGKLAAAYFIGNRPLAALVGHVFTVGEIQVVPLPHPSGVSRWLNEPSHQALLAQGLALLSELRASLDLPH